MRKLSTTEKGMITMILLFIIGIAVRWQFVSTAVFEAVSNLLGIGS